MDLVDRPVAHAHRAQRAAVAGAPGEDAPGKGGVVPVLSERPPELEVVVGFLLADPERLEAGPVRSVDSLLGPAHRRLLPGCFRAHRRSGEQRLPSPTSSKQGMGPVETPGPAVAALPRVVVAGKVLGPVNCRRHAWPRARRAWWEEAGRLGCQR